MEETYATLWRDIIRQPNPKLSKAFIDALVKASTVVTQKMGDTTTVVQLTLPNGFEIVNTSSCVDPANYNEDIGREIALRKIADKIWNHYGFLLQEVLAGERLVET